MSLRKRVKIPLIMGTVLTVIVLFAYFSVQPRTWDDIERSKVLNVATEYSALGYVVDGDSVSGFEYELLKRFADSLNFALNIVVEPDLEKNIEGLNRGDYDIIMKLLPTTLELKSAVQFSQPLIKNHLVLVQLAPTEGTPVRHVADLEGHTLTMPEHSPDELVLRNIKDETGINFDINHLPDIDVEHVLAMVARGNVDDCRRCVYRTSRQTVLSATRHRHKIGIRTTMRMGVPQKIGSTAAANIRCVAVRLQTHR